ncbi:phosphoesterase [Halalkalibacter wakoensis JCM 9140]|uniref:Phosphoesterase n=1 Tax=Halalkalibacter wakoensis JCM 9140 TaxID=1236970 RepID=W4PZ39_9BACI|nr:phosphatase PAP2 family protein [Halalkalibacter wakoensis]GAE24399.1 phosphoesterase [Halalkalibacter wakoensis JCM 9140]
MLLNTKQISIATGCLILFVLISIFSIQNQLVLIDQMIISFLVERSSTFLVTVMEAITKIGSGETILLLTFIIGGFLLVKKMWGVAILLFTLSFGGIALNFFLKILFQRERPGEMSVIEVFGYSLEIASYSFPSGHTMRSVILFSFLIFLCYRLVRHSLSKMMVLVLFMILIVAVALSRIIVGAHFPSDIFAAITISITWFYFCLFLLRYIFRNQPLTL